MVYVELVCYDNQMETERVVEAELLENLEQAKGYAVASGVVELDSGALYLEVSELASDGFKYLTTIYE
jgi:enoyl reductase-like protein